MGGPHCDTHTTKRTHDEAHKTNTTTELGCKLWSPVQVASTSAGLNSWQDIRPERMEHIFFCIFVCISLTLRCR